MTAPSVGKFFMDCAGKKRNGEWRKERAKGKKYGKNNNRRRKYRRILK